MKDAVKMVAELMAISARTAPKSAGQDYVDIKVASDAEKERIGNRMIEMEEKEGRARFARDGRNVLQADALILIGCKENPALGLDCGACGYNCKEAPLNSVELEYRGPSCAFRLVDLGIALGSAVKTAGIHNVDNRIMYRAGVVARELKIMDQSVVFGIPLSATGKNPFFDRGTPSSNIPRPLPKK